MKFFTITLCFVLSCFLSIAQSICETANEGGTVVLNAPPGTVFTSVSFASYGTPNGSCGSFTIGACHAANSQSIVEAAVIGNNSVNIAATNGVFGDPCGGTVKRLYVEAVYAAALPLKLVSFTGSVVNKANHLAWETTEEINTKSFDLERSVDGNDFEMIETIIAANSPGTQKYIYVDEDLASGTYFYRLKMNDLDGKFVFSPVVKIQNLRSPGIETYPNPVTDLLNISNITEPGWVDLISAQGNLLLQTKTTAGALTIDISKYPKGIYFIRFRGNSSSYFTRILKQ